MTNIDLNPMTRNILAIAAREYPKLPLAEGIARATRDYCDNPALDDDMLDAIAETVLSRFNRI